MNKATPPKIPKKFFQWFCRESLQESILGDLEEQFDEDAEKHGSTNAKWKFTWNVIRFCRSGIRKPLSGTYKLNHYGIFKNYFKTSLRTLNKNRLFSSINIVGLAISMSVGILMIVFLSEIYSYDDFHTQKNNIYRVTTHYNARGRIGQVATSSHYIGHQLQAKVPGVNKMLILLFNGRPSKKIVLKSGQKAIAIRSYYASASFFDVLSFKLIKGNPQTVLENPGTIVITASTAKKLFGDSDPMGKTLTVDGNSDFSSRIITGVLEDPPMNSHLNFEALVSMKTMENSPARWRGISNNPGNCWDSYVYLVLNEGAKVEEIESMMVDMVADYNSQQDDSSIAHYLQPMSEFVAGNERQGGQPGPLFPVQKINLMLGLTFIVLLSACFNYTNLSMARALRRTKEISVRKVIGATKLQVFSQFMVEAILLSFIALIIGLLLFFILKPEFLNLPNPRAGGRQMFLLDIQAVELFYILIFAIIVGCIAGFFPAMFLSRLKAGALFIDARKGRLLSGFSAKKLLITFQFTLSISLIMCAVIVNKQYKFAVNYDLGYETKNIVNVYIKGDYADLLENEYVKMPEVVQTSRSNLILGVGSSKRGYAISEDRSDTLKFFRNEIDVNYLDMHGFELLAGSGFLVPLNERGIPNNVIVNKEFLKALNLGSSEEAIGKSVWHKVNGEDVRLKIQGVVNDFITRSLDGEYSKAFVFFRKKKNQDRILGVKIRSNDLLSTMDKLESSYQKLDPLHPFEASFYDDDIARTYEQHKAAYTIISFLAFLAISISTLGLLGMAVFTTESRMKEISIRKVLGAGIRDLSLLLSKGFLLLMGIAGLIAIPVTLYIVEETFLSDFVYSTKIGMVEALSGFVIVLLIGIVTIGWQVRTTAIQNPADLLRDE